MNVGATAIDSRSQHQIQKKGVPIAVSYRKYGKEPCIVDNLLKGNPNDFGLVGSVFPGSS